MSMFGSLRYMAMMSGFSGGNAGSGGGAPSDWNAKEGEPGYILNKPFGDNTAITVFPEETISINEDIGAFMTSTPVAIPPEGTVCTVTINGSKYESTLRMFTLDGMSAPILGTPAPFGGEDTGEPFSIMMVPPEMSEMAGGLTMQIMVIDGSADDITISIDAVSVKKIAYEFMPNGYPSVEITNGVILPETEFEVNSVNMAYTTAEINGNFAVGKTYTVTWNGVDYATVAKTEVDPDSGLSVMYIGNEDMITGTDTGEPFTLMVGKNNPAAQSMYPGATLVAHIFDKSTSVVISISGETEVVREMDARFIKTAIDKETKDLLRVHESEYTQKVEGSFPVYLDLFGNGELQAYPLTISKLLSLMHGDSYPHGGVLVSWGGEWKFAREVFTFTGDLIGDVATANGMILRSSTEGSSKYFKIAVDDSGTISATEV